MDQLPQHIKSISELHRLYGLAQPMHPLLSVINFDEVQTWAGDPARSRQFDFYTIAVKRNFAEKFKYGQQEYDFDKGILTFIAPHQVVHISSGGNASARHTGWLLLIHPDFLWNKPLAKSIRQYEYFTYAVNEALFLSEQEEDTINGIIKHITKEYQSPIDRFSQDIILAQLEVLLSYAERFYQRQFITRKISNHQVLDRLEALLDDYFGGHKVREAGLPTVHNIAASLQLSPGYLSNLLTVLTGRSTQQHIHEKLIEEAKKRLSTTSLSVGEIAYELGFEHSQSFSKLFKMKTNLTPLEFRMSFD